MSSLFAFLHHIAAFALVAAVTVQLLAIRRPLSMRSARELLADAAIGISAAVVLAAGLLRVFYFEKGAGYYFNSAPFLIKLSLFFAVALLSIYPTVEFFLWRKVLQKGRVPQVDARKLRTIRRILHWELAGIALLILNAALMSRGVGFLS